MRVFWKFKYWYIERDQQGKQNSYNYNYWSSPVSKTRRRKQFQLYSFWRFKRRNSFFVQKNNKFGDGAYFADGDL
jgi:hypothetical protein